ncbi:antibiotic biosynthesis monooxygenase family protein [Burkholderia cepacia]|uniref:antibiotic biosynthesis monooxygenase family protein n=1 Tax=Burkholderia cepacia TaxID=292 RepID=UPI002AB7769E|nr:antibiotic biosynthesis monooxygenase family protein [Burkholderia cepacia]
MIKLEEMDPVVGIRDQLSASVEGPLVLVNVFHVAEDDTQALLDAWKEDSHYFKSQPGLISAQLHRGIAGSCTFMNYAVWEDLASFRAAFSNPVFQSKLAKYPDSATGSPTFSAKWL